MATVRGERKFLSKFGDVTLLNNGEGRYFDDAAGDYLEKSVLWLYLDVCVWFRDSHWTSRVHDGIRWWWAIRYIYRCLCGFTMASLRCNNMVAWLRLRCGYWRGHVMSWMQRKNGIWLVCLHFGRNGIYLWTRPVTLQREFQAFVVRSSQKKCHCQLLFAECGIVSTEVFERFNLYFTFNIL